jgi:hypothetical protein
MISRSALAVARVWCGFERRNFVTVGRRCVGYMRVRQAVIGPFETQGQKDDAFLTLIRGELDHPQEDELERRNHALWTSLL